MTRPRILITGPTASGKTELAIRLAEELDGEIISVDARQCYRGMETGSAAPTPAERRRAPHHNVAMLDPFERDSAAAFRQRALRWEEEIRNREKSVIYCGGGTLYLQALISPFDEVPPPDMASVAALEEEAMEHGLSRLYERLLSVDPAYAARMDGMNRQRIIRALDVWMRTGRPFSSFHTRIGPQEPPADLLIFAIRWPREALHQRIAARTREMFMSGLREEVTALMEMAERRRGAPTTASPPPTAGHDPLRTLGFEQMRRHLEGELTMEEAIRQATAATRQYARRQTTWLRRWPFVRWIDAPAASPGLATPPPQSSPPPADTPPPAGGPDTGHMLRLILREVAAKGQKP